MNPAISNISFVLTSTKIGQYLVYFEIIKSFYVNMSYFTHRCTLYINALIKDQRVCVIDINKFNNKGQFGKSIVNTITF